MIFVSMFTVWAISKILSFKSSIFGKEGLDFQGMGGLSF